MLSASTKMELRVEFAFRVAQILGPECWCDISGEHQWLEIMREFMAGRLITVRRVDQPNGGFGWDVTSDGKI